jgi:hypothetical protein
MATVPAAAGIVATVVAGVVLSGVASRADAAEPDQFLVSQIQFPMPLVMRGDRVEIGYDAQRGPNLVETPSAIGTLYVRNNLQRSYTAIPLRIRKTLPGLCTDENHVKLRAVVPDRLLRGQKLFYYAVIQNRRLDRSVTVPAAGARAPESVWIINDAFRVNLGTHVFGSPKAPEAVVAKAGPTEVGFGRDGLVFGPKSFDITSNRSFLLWDSVNGRVLVWASGQPNTPARTVKLPSRAGDVAAGPAGSVYLLRDGPAGAPSGRLTRLSAAGKVLWTSVTTRRPPGLVTGPAGTVYTSGPAQEESTQQMARTCWGNHPWVPVATSNGRPLSVAAQERGTLRAQPLAGGMRLVRMSAAYSRFGGPREARVALINRAGRVARAWRLRSRTEIPLPLWGATPTLVGGDPVIVLSPTVPQGGQFRGEYLVLRLGPRGGIRTRFTLPNNDPPRSAYGDGVLTDIRATPDGQLYQLGSAPDFGAAIYRYSLAPAR